MDDAGVINTNFQFLTMVGSIIVPTVSSRKYVVGAFSDINNSNYNTILSQNIKYGKNSMLQWALNTHYTRGFRKGGFDPAPVNALEGFGTAIIIAASDSDPITSGTGYALAYGKPNTPNPNNPIREFRLVKFTGGLNSNSNITEIILIGQEQFAGSTNYVSIRLTYFPLYNRWTLYVRDDGAASLSDPLTTNNLIGSAFDSTYTNISLPYFCYHTKDGVTTGASQRDTRFKNFSISFFG